MATAPAARLLLCGIAAAAVACAGSPAGTPTAPVPAVTPTSLAIAGLPSAFAVDDRVQLSARASYSDGRIETVTARWGTTAPACVVDVAGLLTAIAEGECGVEASIDGARAAASLRVDPSRVFTVSGTVRERWGVREPVIPFATVTVMSGPQAGRQVTADADGRFELAAVPKGTVAIRAGAAGFDSNTDDASPSRASVDFRLDPRMATVEGTFTSVFPGPFNTGANIPFEVRVRGPVTVTLVTTHFDCGTYEKGGAYVWGGGLPLMGPLETYACRPNVPTQKVAILDPAAYSVRVFWMQFDFMAGAVRTVRVTYPGG